MTLLSLSASTGRPCPSLLILMARRPQALKARRAGRSWVLPTMSSPPPAALPGLPPLPALSPVSGD